MRRFIIILLPLLALVAHAQHVGTGAVTKYTSGANKNGLTEDLTVGSGRTVTVAGGGTLSGAGTFDFHLGTVTLPGLLASIGITNGAVLDSFAAAQNGTAQNLTATASPTFAGVRASPASGQALITLYGPDAVGGDAVLNWTAGGVQQWSAGVPHSGSGAWALYNSENLGGTALLTMSNATSSTGAVKVGYTTDSTSTTTGALQVAGGAGITKALYVGTIAKIGSASSGLGQQTLNLAPSSTNAWLVINRPASSNIAIAQFGTSSTPDWSIGESSGSDSDFHLFNYGTSADAIVVSRATSGVTVIGNLSANGTTATFSTGNATISLGSFASASRANPALRSDAIGDLDVSAGSGGVLSLNYDTKVPLKTYGDTTVSRITTSSSTTTGAFVVGSNVGLSGNAGGPSYFGGQVIAKGTTINDNAGAGCVGEYVTSTIPSGSAVVLTSGAAANVTSITLTAGDWDVTGQCDFALTGASTTLMASGSSPTSATFDVQDSFTQYPIPTTTLTGEYDQVMPTRRVSISATTTLYLVAKATFSAGTASASGTIRARRVR